MQYVHLCADCDASSVEPVKNFESASDEIDADYDILWFDQFLNKILWFNDQ